MNNNMFYNVVRAYARLSARLHRSYAGAVSAMLTAHCKAILMATTDTEERERLTSEAEAFVSREYGAADLEYAQYRKDVDTPF